MHKSFLHDLNQYTCQCLLNNYCVYVKYHLKSFHLWNNYEYLTEYFSTEMLPSQLHFKLKDVLTLQSPNKVLDSEHPTNTENRNKPTAHDIKVQVSNIYSFNWRNRFSLTALYFSFQVKGHSDYQKMFCIKLKIKNHF